MQPIARGNVAAAGLKKHLPVLPTARWKAHVLRIVDAGVGSLIFAF